MHRHRRDRSTRRHIEATRLLDRRKLLKCAVAVLLPANPVVSPAQAQTIRRLVLVHGRSLQVREPTSIRSEAAAALQEGARKLGRALPSGFEFALAYYGDRLDGFAARSNFPLVSEISPSRVREYEAFVTFQAKIAEQLRRKAGIRDEQVEAEYGRSAMPRTALNVRWVQANLRALDKYGPGMTRTAVETFTRDVFLYATRADVRQEIDRAVGRELEQPAVVVGHALGSVVAYNVLCGDAGARVPLYVTVGSPLGMPAVRDLFLPLRSPWPPLGAWFNAYDPRDCLAMYALDKINFPVGGAIENYGAVGNPTSDHHGVVGYLDDAAVAQKILDALGA
jgi:hypothetical protein